ncbi:MAG: hypothetical protein ACK56I_05770, partial [bacterium]
HAGVDAEAQPLERRRGRRPEAVAPGLVDRGRDAEAARDLLAEQRELLALESRRQVAGEGIRGAHLLDMRGIDPGMELRADLAEPVGMPSRQHAPAEIRGGGGMVEQVGGPHARAREDRLRQRQAAHRGDRDVVPREGALP